MPRSPNYELLNKVLEFIKMENFKAGGSVELRLVDIAVGVGESTEKTDKILRIANALEQAGNIKIYRGTGSFPNRYEFIKDDINIKELVNIKDNSTADLGTIISQLNEVTIKLTEYLVTTSKKNRELNGQLNYYKQALEKLEYIGTNPQDGSTIFMVKGNDTSLQYIVEELKRRSDE